MADKTELVTVFRSADASAMEDAQEIAEILAGQEIEAKVFDDHAPGVFEGSVEVRVAAQDAARAEEIIAGQSVEGDMAQADPSSVLDPVTVWQGLGTEVEFRATAIEGMLTAAGIQPIVVGTRAIPTLPFKIQVAREQAGRAVQLIAAAEATGAAAADEEAG